MLHDRLIPIEWQRSVRPYLGHVDDAKALGWQPRQDDADGLRRTWEYNVTSWGWE